LKSFAVGQTPTAFEISFTPSSSAMIPAPETSSGAEMSTPARRKKKGVSNAKEIDRIRSIRTRSVWNKPATTSPPTYAGRTASLPAAVAKAPNPRSTASRNLISGSLTRWPNVLITNRIVTGSRARTATLTAT